MIGIAKGFIDALMDFFPFIAFITVLFLVGLFFALKESNEVRKGKRRCNSCYSHILPCGRSQLEMLDGGIVELIVMICPRCLTLHLEKASVASTDIPNYTNETA